MQVQADVVSADAALLAGNWKADQSYGINNLGQELLFWSLNVALIEGDISAVCILVAIAAIPATP